MVKDNTSLNKMFGIEAVLSLNEPLPAVDVWLVLDMLRASTTIVTWFERGGRAIYPEMSVEEALSLKKRMMNEAFFPAPFLMGEKDAVPPDGFDAGNSPLEIDPQTAAKRPTAVMATTNGTRAIVKAVATGAAVYVVCARNALYALDAAVAQGRNIGILCAGRLGRPAVDDTLCAGLIIEKLCGFLPNYILSDGANIALKMWRNSTGSFESNIRSAVHAKYLEKIGFSDDIGFACEQDAAAFVPEVKEVTDFRDSELRALITCERKSGLEFLTHAVTAGTLKEEKKQSDTGENKKAEDGDIFFGSAHVRKKTPGRKINLDFGGKKV